MYDVMTTNIAESLKSILMDEREYLVSYIFNSIAIKFGEKLGSGMTLSMVKRINLCLVQKRS